ncbi:hypothetical protein Desti_1269 [Desulfomonile tiedjei DSM 6799]|uniref:Uncharacterized protein n=1 Tax=Desulfomonile tiedjei (strain ATCC 49306 / DSM 6799 / DCB-1) TaxID=706587 RepID=I4C341_DESTA|nr:hypothetical protein Desti_1269 [Desulfomonile tiedjei DSM 6799]
MIRENAKQKRAVRSQGGNALERCKTCGKEYTANQTMTYSVYGYCSWECLMNKNTKRGNSNRPNRKNSGVREVGSRSKWAQNY